MRARPAPGIKGLAGGFRGSFGGAGSAGTQAQKAVGQDVGHLGQARLG